MAWSAGARDPSRSPCRFFISGHIYNSRTYAVTPFDMRGVTATRRDSPAACALLYLARAKPRAIFIDEGVSMTKKQQLLMAAAAASLSFSATSFAAGAYGGSGDGSSAGTARGAKACEGLTGSALQTCMQQQQSSPRTPGTSDSPAAGGSRRGSTGNGGSSDSGGGSSDGGSGAGSGGAGGAGGGSGGGSGGGDGGGGG